MADAKKAAAPAPAKGMKYYKNNKHAGQRFLVKAHEDDPTKNEYVSFTKVRETFQGDSVLRGYLATDDAAIQKRAEANPNVEEIKKADYDKALQIEG